MSNLINNALKSIFAHKVRSFLTMLGVIIGVFSVVVLVSIGTGVKEFITNQFNSLGSNLVIVAPGKVDFSDDPAKSASRNKLDEKHLDLIETYSSDFVAFVTPSVRISEAAKYKTKTMNTTVIGGNYNALNIFNYEIAQGSFFSRQDLKTKSEVVVIGDKVKENLFSNQSPIGQRIKLGDDSYEIIGVFEPKGGSLDDNVVAPYTTVQKTYDIKNFSSIGIKVKDKDQIDRAMKNIELSLLRDLKEDDFTVLSQTDILGSITRILNLVTVGISSIAGISLIVGGIGIMNIMLVVVTERIQEIGLRKALGATSRSIAIQFMMESMIISLFGGIVGLFLGYIASLIAQRWVNTSVSLGAVLLSVSFSCLIGVIFGTYPAYKAAKKDPIEALRAE